MTQAEKDEALAAGVERLAYVRRMIADLDAEKITDSMEACWALAALHQSCKSGPKPVCKMCLRGKHQMCANYDSEVQVCWCVRVPALVKTVAGVAAPKIQAKRRVRR